MSKYGPKEPSNEELREAWADQLEAIAKDVRAGDFRAFAIFVVPTEPSRVYGGIKHRDDDEVAYSALLFTLWQEVQRRMAK
jgi:hypothetical protein